jgi:hypothetical protein
MEDLNKHKFIYWIKERETVRNLKEMGLPKPWSIDPVFQVTYFCNVNREHDKVTRWIRENYDHRVKEYVPNMILAPLGSHNVPARCVGECLHS